MFAIYNLQGRTFRNSLEQLQKVHQPHANEAVGVHTDTAQDETVPIQGSTTGQSSYDSKSIAAYRKMLHTSDRSHIIHAYQIMTHPVISLQSNQTLGEALDLFEEHGFQQVPIQSLQLEIVGLLTFHQLIRKRYHDGLPLNTSIEQIIDQEVITVDPVSEVRRVARVLYEYKLAALPVMNENDHLVGIISKTDILKALMTDPPISLWT